MNVVKNEFLSNQKKLRLRSRKHLKSNMFGYHTVSRGLPFPSTSAMPGTINSGKSSDLYQTCITTSRSDSASKFSTSDEVFVREFQTSILKRASDDSEEQSEFSDSCEQGHEMEIVTQFKNFMASSRTFRGRTTSKDNVSFGSLQDKSESDTSDSDVDFFNIKGPPIGSDNTSKESSHHTSGSGELNIEHLEREYESMNETSTSNSTPLRLRSTTSSAKSWNKSSTSSYTRTPSAKSMRSTPKTSGSGRITSSDSETGSYILAMTEGRGHARGEVGIAAIDIRRPHLVLCQISDNQRYIHSLTKMSVFNFLEIIMPHTFIDGLPVSKLYADVRQHFPHVEVISVQRRHFNESAGLELIKQYCSPESESIMILVKDKFYALSAASALIKYVEYSQNILFAPRSVRVEYQGTEDSMIVDLNTANRLELVTSRINDESVSNNTLLGVLKHCRTKGGVRLLRANILQPPCSLSKIEMRLDCVTELVEKPLLFFAMESAVSNFVKVENLLTLCMHEPQQDGLKAAEFQLKYVLLLKTILELLPTLRTALEEATCEFYAEVRENLSDVRYKIILDRILKVIPENVKSAKGSLSSHLHSCFAIKTGINGLLDIAKKTYCEIVQEIWDLINSLRDKYHLPLKMSFSAPRGFHIQYTPERNVKEPDLPKEFILVQKTRATYYFYTAELVALDQRCQHVLNEVKIMSNVILYELLSDIRNNIGCLFNLCEYVAEIDVIVGFAHVSSGENYVRPKFGNVLNIVESRHPILDVIHEGKVVPNDVFAEKEKNFAIITGPNQSGKSIYIGQVALLQIMAQIGCYVPAKEATFRMADRLFSRMGCDSIESNASTLLAEMREMDYLKQNLTGNSLVIIDELCRGTSVEEGTSLAFTICEELLDSTAFVFVTTHYMFLTKLEEMYFNVTNYHFESHLVKTERGMSLRFTHQKLPGVTAAEQYGLQIAEQTSFPRDVLAVAKQIAQKLSLERKPLSEVDNLAARYRLSQRFNKELSEGLHPDEVATTILRYKTMLLNLKPLKECYEFDTESRRDSPKETPETRRDTRTTVEQQRKRKMMRGNIAEVLCKRIKRKYRVLTSRKHTKK